MKAAKYILIFLVVCAFGDDKKVKHSLYSPGLVNQASIPRSGYNMFSGYNMIPRYGYNRFINRGGYNTGYYPPQNQ